VLVRSAALAPLAGRLVAVAGVVSAAAMVFAFAFPFIGFGGG
jgi:hypothetical protein